jgi:predicted alpha/beta-fold hydrolase
MPAPLAALQNWAIPTGEWIALEWAAPDARWKAGMPKLNRDGVEIYYEVHGSGPTLLLTHGYSSTSEMWQGQIEALSKHHQLVLWDMRGHGRSDYPDDPGL